MVNNSRAREIVDNLTMRNKYGVNIEPDAAELEKVRTEFSNIGSSVEDVDLKAFARLKNTDDWHNFEKEELIGLTRSLRHIIKTLVKEAEENQGK